MRQFTDYSLTLKFDAREVFECPTVDEFWIAWVEVVDNAAPFEADLSKQRLHRDVAAIGRGKYFWSTADRDQIS